MWAGARRRLLAITGSAVVVAGACTGSGFQYVANTADDVFFKVPEGWTLFDEEEVITAGVTQLDDRVVTALRDRTWLRGFDAGPEPDPRAVLDRASSHPRGYGEVRRLTFEERDGLSLAALRAWGFGFDPLQEVRERPDGGVQLLHLEDITTDDGAHGVRVIVLLDGETGQSVVDQTVLLDAATTRLFRFTIGCSLSCYEANRDLISEIADSWTLEEVP